MLRSKFHRPWQPRVRDQGILNPFAHTTEPEASLAEHQELKEFDELVAIAVHYETDELFALEAIAERSQTGEPASASVKALEMAADSGVAG
jgi:hypothetical protein